MKREIITLCGSTRFKDEFRAVERQLTMEGKIVLPPAFFGKTEGLDYTPEMAKHLYDLHLNKIDISDGIYVINVNGYIGDSTTKEIAYAQSQGKFVRYFLSPN